MAKRKRKPRPTLLPSKPCGPKTPQGKHRSSLNALKHGRYSRTLLSLFVDDPALFDSLFRKLQARATSPPPSRPLQT